ncbi:MAG: cupin domain-containing protein [Methylobacter sp.]
MNKQQLIEKLSLTPHIEGGYFCRTYSSDLKTGIAADSRPRSLLSSIFYMLTEDSPIGHLHKNKSDIIHYFHGGSPLTYYILHPDGTLEKRILGTDLDSGQQLQLIVRGGCWKASELETGEFGLISEAVSPGFDYDDMELAEKETIKTGFPQVWDQLSKYVR